MIVIQETTFHMVPGLTTKIQFENYVDPPEEYKTRKTRNIKVQTLMFTLKLNLQYGISGCETIKWHHRKTVLHYHQLKHVKCKHRPKSTFVSNFSLHCCFLEEKRIKT